MLTTAGEAFLAAKLKLPVVAPGVAVPEETSNTCKSVPQEGRCSHSGVSVINTNQTATNTVTVCENNNHKRFLLVPNRPLESPQGLGCGG